MRSFLSFERHRRVWIAGLALLAALLFACQHKQPEEELLKKIEPVGSWLASLQMAGEKWLANSVPSAFLKNTVAAARKELDSAAEEIAKSPARPEVRDPLRRLVTEATAANTGLERAVEINDRKGVARHTGRLAELHATFEALQEKNAR